jgi:hypothetical protein
MATETKVPAVPADHCEVTFASQYRMMMPGTVYTLAFGQLLAFRRNAACPKIEPQGVNKDAYLAFEKKQPK